MNSVVSSNSLGEHLVPNRLDTPPSYLATGDRRTWEVIVRRFVAVDDCGYIINPMIVEGQIHGG